MEKKVLYTVLILTIIIFMLLLDLFVARTYRHEKVPHYSTPAKYNLRRAFPRSLLRDCPAKSVPKGEIL
jgi:hypothetical protein